MDRKEIIDTIQFYYFEKLGWCGCGMPGVALKIIGKYLEGRKENRKISDNPLALCLAYELDRAEFTEHGSSIYGCWLTENGEKFLEAIQEAEKMGIIDSVI